MAECSSIPAHSTRRPPEGPRVPPSLQLSRPEAADHLKVLDGCKPDRGCTWRTSRNIAYAEGESLGNDAGPLGWLSARAFQRTPPVGRRRDQGSPLRFNCHDPKPLSSTRYEEDQELQKIVKTETSFPSKYVLLAVNSHATLRYKLRHSQESNKRLE